MLHLLNKDRFAVAATSSLRQTDVLWKGAGVESRGWATHDQWKCVCMFLQSLAMLQETV